jgi:hypothetical protein
VLVLVFVLLLTGVPDYFAFNYKVLLRACAQCVCA